MVVDDDVLMHEGIRMFLGEDYSIATFTSGEEAVATARREIFPVVILDLRMEDMPGIDALKRLKKICPHQQVIILTGHSCRESAIAALNLGAFRYLTKPFGIAPFKAIVSEAFERYEFVTNSHSDSFASAVELQSLGLSVRETDVALEILQDQSNLGIAKILGIAPRTVEKHVERILSLFGISSRKQLPKKIKSLRRRLNSPRRRKNDTQSGKGT